MSESVIPSTYHYSLSSMPPFDLNYEDPHQLLNTNPNHNQLASSSLSYSLLYTPDQHQGGSSYWEPKPSQSNQQEACKVVPSSTGSWDHPAAVEKDENCTSDLKVSVWKKLEADGNENLQGGGDDHEEDNSSVKWMPLKIRMKRSRVMVPDQTKGNSDIAGISEHENQKIPLTHLRRSSTTDNSSNNNFSNHNSNNITIRVCADCNTTKTPLWRGGPTGPKSLCNACGIRQRKARRALAEAAAENGTTPPVVAAADVDRSHHVKGNHNKLQSKGKKSKSELKKKHNHLGVGGRKKLGSDSDQELTISLSSTKNLGFPQDEKEAAILLMALSHGQLLHGFPLDL